jgi:hypothetical protein
MNEDITKHAARADEGSLFDNWIDAIEDGVRSRVRNFIETMLEEELSQVLARPRYPNFADWAGLAKLSYWERLMRPQKVGTTRAELWRLRRR